MRRLRIEPRLLAKRRLLMGLALCIGAIASPGAAQEPTPVQKLDQAMAGLADTIQTRLKDQGETQIRMGAFDGPDGGSQRMMKSLKDELTKRGLVVTDKAGWKVSAEYFLDTEAGADLATLMIEAKVKQPGGRTATEIRYVIGNETEMAQALGSTFEPTQPPAGATPPAGQPPVNPGAAPPAGQPPVNPGAAPPAGQPPVKPGAAPPATTQVSLPAQPIQDPLKRTEALVQAVNTPQFGLTGNSIISARPDSPYQVEILVKKGPQYVPCPLDGPLTPPGLRKGKPFVKVTEGDSYAIKIYNNSGAPVGAEVRIDGVNMFAFSQVPSYKQIGKLFVKPGHSPLIRGWHFVNGPGGTREFLVVPWENSAQAVLGTRDESTIGVITVTFFSAWVGDTPPPDEPLARGGELATGVGKPTDNSTRDILCHFGQLRSNVTIRYAKPTPPGNLPPP